MLIFKQDPRITVAEVVGPGPSVSNCISETELDGITLAAILNILVIIVVKKEICFTAFCHISHMCVVTDFVFHIS